MKGDRKLTTQEVRRIDLRDLRKSHSMTPGTAFLWSWQANRISDMGKIAIAVYKDKLRLRYTINQAGESQEYDYPVYFQYTLCNLGGQRAWLTCPLCGKRVAVLYFRRYYFYCRTCQNLNYASSQETNDETAKGLRQIKKLKKKLKAADTTVNSPIPDRPKGMHHRTYNELVEQLRQAENKYWQGVSKKFSDFI